METTPEQQISVRTADHILGIITKGAWNKNENNLTPQHVVRTQAVLIQESEILVKKDTQQN